MNPRLSRLGIPSIAHARVTGPWCLGLLACARALGVDLDQIGTATGYPDLPKAVLGDIPVLTWLALLDETARLSNDPYFGLHFGQQAKLMDTRWWGIIVCSCPDIRAAIKQTIRFDALVQDLGRTELLVRGDVGHYRWHSPWLYHRGGRHMIELATSAIRTVYNQLLHTDLPLHSVTFPHALPEGGDLDEYERVLRTKVHFGGGIDEHGYGYVDGLASSSLLDRPIPHAETSLFDATTRFAEGRLTARQREIAEDPFVAKVRERLAIQLAYDETSLPLIAANLGFTPRTFQRRLVAAGTSFTTLLDDVRRTLAQRYLLDETKSLTEVAFLLGFSEQSTFNHTFRGWFGITPSAWRTNNTSAMTEGLSHTS